MKRTTTITAENGQAEGKGPLWLSVVASPDTRARHMPPISLQSPVTVGRECEAGGTELDDPAMSRKHFSIECSEAGLLAELKDLDSKNGTFVNARRIKRRYLEAGDVIRAGSTLFLVLADFPAADWRDPIPAIVGRSSAMRSVKETIGRFASSKLPVLILGETGTGKELVAQALHDLSGRKGRFLGVNCSAVPDNLFESTFFGHRKGAFTGAEADSGGLLRECQGGTLLLDEIGELSAQAQAKLLRFLEEGRVRPVGDVRDVPVEVRIVAATNAPIREMEQAGKFRSDLLARLEGVVLELPPLGERRDDIPLLISALGREAGCPSPTIEPDALEAVMVAAWPRNVRGLRTLLLRLAESSGGEAGGPDGAWKIRLKDLPGELSDPVTHRRMAPLPPPAQGDDRPPREELERVLADFGGNVAGVAQHYGRHRRQVYRWLERYGLKAGLDGSGGRKI